jgi:hypothetical protein
VTKVRATSAGGGLLVERRTAPPYERERWPRTTKGHVAGTGESDCAILPMKQGNARTLGREGRSEAAQ